MIDMNSLLMELFIAKRSVCFKPKIIAGCGGFERKGGAFHIAIYIYFRGRSSYFTSEIRKWRIMGEWVTFVSHVKG